MEKNSKQKRFAMISLFYVKRMDKNKQTNKRTHLIIFRYNDCNSSGVIRV